MWLKKNHLYWLLLIHSQSWKTWVSPKSRQNLSQSEWKQHDYIYADHICREPIVLKGRLWIKQQQNEGQLSNQSTSGLGESSSSKLDKLKNPAKYNSSNGGFASQGGLFAGKDTVQKQIKDALKANLKRPNKEVGVKKKMRFQTQDLTKIENYINKLLYLKFL